MPRRRISSTRAALAPLFNTSLVWKTPILPCSPITFLMYVAIGRVCLPASPAENTWFQLLDQPERFRPSVVMPARSRQLAALVSAPPKPTMLTAKNDPLLWIALHAVTPPSTVSLLSTFLATTVRPKIPPLALTSSIHVWNPS